MNHEAFNLPTVVIAPESQPKTELDRAREREDMSLRTRVIRRALGNIGFKRAGEYQTGRAANLQRIAESQSPLDEVDSQLEQARNSRFNRIKKRLFEAAFGKDTFIQTETGKVTRLESIKYDLESKDPTRQATVETVPDPFSAAAMEEYYSTVPTAPLEKYATVDLAPSRWKERTATVQTTPGNKAA